MRAAVASDVLFLNLCFLLFVSNTYVGSYIIYSWKHRATLVFAVRHFDGSISASAHVTEIITDLLHVASVGDDLVLLDCSCFFLFGIALDDVGGDEGGSTCLASFAGADLLESLALSPFPDHEHDLDHKDDDADDQGSNWASVCRLVTLGVRL